MPQIKVQRGAITLSTTQASNTATIASVNTSKSIELSSSNVNGLGGSSPTDITEFIFNKEWFSNIQLTGATTMTARRLVAALTYSVHHPFEVVEYVGTVGGENEYFVRQRSNVRIATTVKTAVCATAITTINNINDCIIIPVGGACAVEGRVPERFTGTLELVASGADWVVQIERSNSSGSYGTNEYTEFVVVELTGSAWTVQKKKFSYSSVGTEETLAISTTGGLGKGFVIDTFRGSGPSTSNIAGLVYLKNTTALGFKLSNSADTPTSCAHIVYVVSNPNLNAEHYNGSIPAGMLNSAPLNIPITQVASMDTTFSRFSVIIDQGAAPAAASPLGVIAGELTSRTNYRLRRAYIRAANVSAGEYRLSIIELPTVTASYKDMVAAAVGVALVTATLAINHVYLVAAFNGTASMTASMPSQQISAAMVGEALMTGNLILVHLTMPPGGMLAQAGVSARLSVIKHLAADFACAASMQAGTASYISMEAGFSAAASMGGLLSATKDMQCGFMGGATLTASIANQSLTPFAVLVETTVISYPRETTVH